MKLNESEKDSIDIEYVLRKALQGFLLVTCRNFVGQGRRNTGLVLVLNLRRT